jgi:hypothetical protein
MAIIIEVPPQGDGAVIRRGLVVMRCEVKGAATGRAGREHTVIAGA